MSEQKITPDKNEEAGNGFPIQLKILMGVILLGLIGAFLKGFGVY